MNKRLDNAFEAARKTLSEDLQEELAAVVEHFISAQSADLAGLLSPEQQAELDRRMARPFEPADPERIKALFARHGIRTDL